MSGRYRHQRRDVVAGWLRMALLAAGIVALEVAGAMTGGASLW